MDVYLEDSKKKKTMKTKTKKSGEQLSLENREEVMIEEKYMVQRKVF